MALLRSSDDVPAHSTGGHAPRSSLICRAEIGRKQLPVFDHWLQLKGIHGGTGTASNRTLLKGDFPRISMQHQSQGQR